MTDLNKSSEHESSSEELGPTLSFLRDNPTPAPDEGGPPDGLIAGEILKKLPSTPS